LKRGINELSTNHRKTAFKLSNCVSRLCGKYGIERIGFLTLTFADHVTCAREAGRRYNSLRAGVLAERYEETICVLERMKSGRIHFHLLVVMRLDIRTGFNFTEASEGVYSSANGHLRAEWGFWRRTAKEYGFGRTELLPVKSNEEGLSKYVGKYIAKHVGAREDRDKGVRLVRYSRGASNGSVAFMFASHRSRLWREQVKEFARRNGCASLDDLTEKFGKRWAYGQREAITSIEPSPISLGLRYVDGEPAEIITLTDVWMADRFERSQRVSVAMGISQAEAFMGLYYPNFADRLERVPDPQRVQRVERLYAELLAFDLEDERQRLLHEDEDGERVDRLTIWNDGRIEKGPL
jgi:hypothetical protein